MSHLDMCQQSPFLAPARSLGPCPSCPLLCPEALAQQNTVQYTKEGEGQLGCQQVILSNPHTCFGEASQIAQDAALAADATLGHLQGRRTIPHTFLSSLLPLSNIPSTPDRAMPPGTGHKSPQQEGKEQPAHSSTWAQGWGPQRCKKNKTT